MMQNPGPGMQQQSPGMMQNPAGMQPMDVNMNMGHLDNTWALNLLICQRVSSIYLGICISLTPFGLVRCGMNEAASTAVCQLQCWNEPCWWDEP